MKSGRWTWLKRMPEILAEVRSEPAEHSRRQAARQRNIFLPARLIVSAIVLFQFFNSPWQGSTVNTYGVIFETIQNILVGYTFFVIATTVVFFVVKKFPPGTVQWFIFALGIADGVFLCGLTVLTGGFDSILYWAYPALIIVNAASIPLATPQIVLNLLLGIIYLTAGLVETKSEPELATPSFRKPIPKITSEEITDAANAIRWLEQTPSPFRKILWDGIPADVRSNMQTLAAYPTNESALREMLSVEVNSIFPSQKSFASITVVRAANDITEPTGTHFILQVTVLLLLTFCCYGVQLLAAAQARAEAERDEFTVRGEQLRSAGRLAAEVAHQIKNPLAIINNVTFSLQRNLASEKPETAKQIEIIREEVAKADRIIVQIMGYAQLTEGRVEKLIVVDELNRAVDEVFPAGVPTGIRVQRNFAAQLPPLLMQRKHFADAVTNLLLNAREASPENGVIHLGTRFLPDESVEITVRDEGSGIPPDKLERIFEAYYTTKARGSGLGLAVVKHNVELYGGTIRAESTLGKGATFTLIFPSKTLMKTIT
jgi:signal transduction histidine kinase